MKVRRGFMRIALILLITTQFLSFVLVNAPPVIPIGTAKQANPFESNPTVVTNSSTVGSVDPVTNVGDGNFNTGISWRIGGSASGILNMSSFNSNPSGGQFAIGWVDIKIRYKASETVDDRYRIYYTVAPSTSIRTLQAYVAGASAQFDHNGAEDERAWSKVAEPNSATWEWTDIANLKVLIQTQQQGGSEEDPANTITVYEVWLSVYSGSYPFATVPLIALGTLDKYYDLNNNNVWDAGEHAVRDVNDNGAYDSGTDVVLAAPMGTPAPLAAKYYDANDNSVWDEGEPAIRDTNGNNRYDSGEVVLAGTAPALGVTLKAPGTSDKYADANGNVVWDLNEPAIRDVDNSGTYNTGDVVLAGTAPTPGVTLRKPGEGNLKVPPATPSSKFYDKNSDAAWSVGEPAIRDSNNNGIFDLPPIGTDTLLVGFQPPGAVAIEPPAVSGLIGGDKFFVDVFVTNVVNMFGFQFIIHYDTNVLTALPGFFAYSPFIVAGPAGIDDTAGWVSVTFSSYFGDSAGFSGSGPALRLYFQVDNDGASLLHFDTATSMVTNVYAEVIPMSYWNDAIFTTTLIHNVAVTDVKTNATQVMPGGKVKVDATLANRGTYLEPSVTVRAYYNDTQIGDPQTVTNLDIGSFQLLTWVWDTAGVAVNHYQIRVVADPVPSESDTTDNVFPRPDLKDGKVIVGRHDIAVTNVTRIYFNETLSQNVTIPAGDTLKVQRGEVVFVNVTVSNLGTFTETFGVNASYKGSGEEKPVDSITGEFILKTWGGISLDPAASQALIVAWNTMTVRFPLEYGHRANYSMCTVAGYVFTEIPFEKGVDYDNTGNNVFKDSKVNVTRSFAPLTNFDIITLEEQRVVGKPIDFNAGTTLTPEGTEFVSFEWDFGDGVKVAYVKDVNLTKPFDAILRVAGVNDTYYDEDSSGAWDADEPAVRDADHNGVYGADVLLVGSAPALHVALSVPGSLDKYYDADNSGTWNASEPAIRDVDGSGTFTAGDVVLGGATPAPNVALHIPGASDKYYDKNGNGVWDEGEPAIRDTNDNGTYEADVVLAGVAPPLGAVLSVPGALDKYYDKNNNHVWDKDETAIRDVDNSGTYNVGDVVLVGVAPPLVRIKYDTSHAYVQTGTFTVILRVGNNLSLFDTAKHDISIAIVDVAVSSVVRAFPTLGQAIPAGEVLKVKQGEFVYGNMTVVNLSTVRSTASLNFTVYSNDIVIQAWAYVPIGNGTSATKSFSWNTTGVSPGSYVIKAVVKPTDTFTIDWEFNKTNDELTDGSVTVLAVPVASFTFAPSRPYVTQSVTFDASASSDADGTITDYAWDFGDGTTKNSATAVVTHAFAEKKKYSVTLTVTDDDGLTALSRGNVTVFVHDVAVTDVSASVAEVVVGEPVVINVAVENQGDFDESSSLILRYDDQEIKTQTVDLKSGDSTTLTFTWDTGGVGAGTYTIEAEASVVVDNDMSDNVMSDGQVVVNAGTNILLYVIVGAVIGVAVVVVLVYLLKFRKPTKATKTA